MMSERPWSIQIELAEGCSRLCSFCGLNGIRDKPGNYKFISPMLMEKLAADCANFIPTARYELAMHGEPTMHPKYLEMIKILRKYVPKAQIQLTTNGVKLRKKGAFTSEVTKIFKAGIDFIILDTYYPERDQLREAAFNCDSPSIKVVDFYDDLVPNGVSVYHNHRRKLRNTVILMDDIGARDGEVKSRTIMNHAGSNPEAPPVLNPLEKTCTNPFREVSVCWNGNVNICCMDWKHEQVLGNVKENTLEEIWFSAKFEAARTALQNKDRRFDPCSKCNKNSGVRAGLLPKYPPLTDEQKEMIGWQEKRRSLSIMS